MSETTKGITLRSVSAMLGWAVRNDLIPTNPAAKVAKPKSRSRGEEAVITEEEHAKLLAATNPEFRAVLRVLHATGCRPGEACAITSDTFDPANAVVKLSVHKCDKSGKPRLIFLPPDIVELLKGQLSRYGSGPLLRSRVGVPYTSVAITRTMCRLKKRHGLRGTAYGMRHTFVTDALASGLPEAHVAALVGHANTTMIHAFYSHLTSRADVLRDAASKVRG